VTVIFARAITLDAHQADTIAGACFSQRKPGCQSIGCM
jgi:hypothetical protein